MDVLNILLNLYCLDNRMGKTLVLSAVSNSSRHVLILVAGFHSYLSGYWGNLEG